MKINVRILPQEDMEEYYIIHYLDKKGYAYVETIGEIYELIQSGYLANQYLIKKSLHLDTSHPK